MSASRRRWLVWPRTTWALAESLLVALMLAASASAQAKMTIEATPNSALGCLQTPDADQRPTYPESDLRRKEDGLVRVRLRFEDKNSAPNVEVFYNSGSERMQDEVSEYVRKYRLPCLTPDAQPFVTTQEFSFVSDGRPVAWSRMREDGALRTAMEACFVDTNTPQERSFRYPRALLQRGIQGTVLARLRFTAPDAPPQFEAVFDGGSELFVDAARQLAQAYRLPCLRPSSPPVSGIQAFAFQVSDAEFVLFKDLDLRQFLGSVERLGQHRARFDLNTMGCPFDLKVTLYQPYLPNGIGEVGAPDANRREFLEWLAAMELALPKKKAPQLIGQTMNLKVPCGTVDLL